MGMDQQKRMGYIIIMIIVGILINDKVAHHFENNGHSFSNIWIMDENE